MKLWKRTEARGRGFAGAVEYRALQMALFAARAIPGRLGLEAGRAVGTAAALVLRRYFHRAVDNLRHAYPEKTSEWIRRTALGSFQHFGQLAAEILNSPRNPAGARWAEIVRVVNEERTVATVREGKGAIFLTGHLGNWELATQLANRHGLRLTSIAHESRNPRIATLMDRERIARGTETVPMEGAFRELIRALKRGHIVALLTDRNPRDNGILVPFFGRDIMTVTTPALMSCMTGAPIINLACLREGNAFRYTLYFGEPMRPDPKKPREQEVDRLTRESTAALERYIRMAPDQWQWMHRRWKITPGGLQRAGLAPATSPR